MRCVERGAGRVEAEAQDAVAGERVAAGCCHCCGDGLAGGEGDLDGADELGRVVGVDQGGGGGVEAGEDAVQMGGDCCAARARSLSRRGSWRCGAGKRPSSSARR